MSSVLTSQGMFLATAMAAVSGTVLLLAAFRHHKSPHFSVSSPSHHLPRSCISSDGKKKEKKKKKRVHFAEDVVDPIGNSDEYRKLRQSTATSNHQQQSTFKNSFNGKLRNQMPENRAALYHGMLKNRVLHRTTYSY